MNAAAEPGAVGAERPDASGLVDPWARIETLRAEGAARRDPVGFAVIEALARRAALQQGDARRLLLARIEQRIAALPAAPAGTSADRDAATQAGAAVPFTLSELVDRLGRPAGLEPRLPDGGSSAGTPVAAEGSARAASRRLPAPAATRLIQTAPRPLKSVIRFKRTWARLRVDQRLRQAYEQVPTQAGPLNSAQVVHRALQTLRGLSPAYLDAFMAHVDTLLALEHANGLAKPGARAAVAAPEAKTRRGGERGARKR